MSEIKVGDRVRYLRPPYLQGESRKPSQAVGEVIRKKGERIWVRFTSHVGEFERSFPEKYIIKEGENNEF